MRVRSTFRSGATLTEVLMALLIMSIGVVSVFSLFPISILSSIRANQLTYAKLLEENIEETIRARDFTAASDWQPGQTYNSSTLIAPTSDGTTSAFPIPNKRFRRRLSVTNINGNPIGANLIFNDTATAQSSLIEPEWGDVVLFNQGTANAFWGVIDGDVRVENPPASGMFDFYRIAWEPVPIVIDPLGANADGLSPVSNSFGNDGANSLPGQIRAHRVNAGITSFNVALSNFASPDSWSVITEATPTALDNTSNFEVQFANEVDVSADSLGPTSRIVFTSVDGSVSHVKTIDVSGTRAEQNSQAKNNLIRWQGGALPTGALDSLGETATVRVETFTSRYTWLLTIPATPQSYPRARCAIIFNRSFLLEDEQAFSYTISDTARTTLVVDTSTGNPLIREGNFMYNVPTGTWHKMVSVSGSGSTVQVILEDSLPRQVQPNRATLHGVFLPGVVSVFEVGT